MPEETKVVRFYFDLGIDYLFPEKPPTYKKSKECWIKYCYQSLGSNIQKKLTPNFDDIQFSKLEALAQNKNLFTIYFSVSICHDFCSKETWIPRKGYTGFKIKKHSLLKAKKSIETQIRNLLCYHYSISKLKLKYFASRDFIFEIFCGGSVTVEKIFTRNELKMYESISDALYHFFLEMESTFQQCGLDGYPTQSETRRDRNNRYTFDVSGTSYMSFNEREVIGDMSLLEIDMKNDDVPMIDIDTDEDRLIDIIVDLKRTFELTLCDNLPTNVELLQLDYSFVDQGDYVYEVSNELLTNNFDI
jgi:hypothetical protein